MANGGEKCARFKFKRTDPIVIYRHVLIWALDSNGLWRRMRRNYSLSLPTNFSLNKMKNGSLVHRFNNSMGSFLSIWEGSLFGRHGCK